MKTYYLLSLWFEINFLIVSFADPLTQFELKSGEVCDEKRNENCRKACYTHFKSLRTHKWRAWKCEDQRVCSCATGIEDSVPEPYLWNSVDPLRKFEMKSGTNDYCDNLCFEHFKALKTRKWVAWRSEGLTVCNCVTGTGDSVPEPYNRYWYNRDWAMIKEHEQRAFEDTALRLRDKLTNGDLNLTTEFRKPQLSFNVTDISQPTRP